MKRKDVDILQVSITDAKNVDPSAMMMGGGAGGALMYLIFDPDMEDFLKLVMRLKTMYLTSGNQENGSLKTSLLCRCHQTKSAIHCIVMI